MGQRPPWRAQCGAVGGRVQAQRKFEKQQDPQRSFTFPPSSMDAREGSDWIKSTFFPQAPAGTVHNRDWSGGDGEGEGLDAGLLSGVFLCPLCPLKKRRIECCWHLQMDTDVPFGS